MLEEQLQQDWREHGRSGSPQVAAVLGKKSAEHRFNTVRILSGVAEKAVVVEFDPMSGEFGSSHHATARAEIKPELILKRRVQLFFDDAVSLSDLSRQHGLRGLTARVSQFRNKGKEDGIVRVKLGSVPDPLSIREGEQKGADSGTGAAKRPINQGQFRQAAP